MLRAADRADRVAKWRAMASGVLDKSKRGLLASAGKFAAAGLVLGAGALGFKWMAERKKKREAELKNELARVECDLQNAIKEHQRNVSAQIEALTHQLRQPERAASAQDPDPTSEANREHMLALQGYIDAAVAATETVRSHTANPDRKALTELTSELRKISDLTEWLAERDSERANGLGALESEAETLGRAFSVAKEQTDALSGRVSGLEASLSAQLEREADRANRVQAVQSQVDNILGVATGLRNVTAQAAKDALQDHGDALEHRLQDFIAGQLIAITLKAREASEASERADRLSAAALQRQEDVYSRVELLGDSFQRAMSELYSAGTDTAELREKLDRLEIAVRALSDSTSGAAFGATSEPLVVSLVRALGAVDAADRRAVAQKMARVLFARAGLKANRAESGSVLYTD